MDWNYQEDAGVRLLRPIIKRNVAVAMGNWLAWVDELPEEAVRVVRGVLENDESLVREHAARALRNAGLDGSTWCLRS